MPDTDIVEESAKLSWIWLALVVLIVDQLTKYWVLTTFQLHQVKKILPILNIYLDYNRGAAFSFLTESPTVAFWLFSSVAIVMSTVLLVWMYRLPKTNTWLSVALSMILGGALGNLLDRLRFGYVVDFINFHLGVWHFAIFNVADIAITLGAAMVIWHMFRLSKKGQV